MAIVISRNILKDNREKLRNWPLIKILRERKVTKIHNNDWTKQKVEFKTTSKTMEPLIDENKYRAHKKKNTKGKVQKTLKILKTI